MLKAKIGITFILMSLVNSGNVGEFPSENVVEVIPFIETVDRNSLKSVSLKLRHRYLPKFSDKEIACLADTIYSESRGEPLEGKLGVANVIFNRISHPDFPRSICSVVRQPGQFTLKKADDDHIRYAKEFSTGYYPNNVGEALYFDSNGRGKRNGRKIIKRISKQSFY